MKSEQGVSVIKKSNKTQLWLLQSREAFMPAPLTEKSSQDFLQLFGCLYDSTFVHHQAER